VGMTSTFSRPMARIWLAIKAAARCTSSLCCGRVLTLGMRSRSFNSPRKRCWFSFAYVTAEDAIDEFSQEAGAGLKAQYSTIFLKLEVYRAGRQSWRQATLGNP